MVLIVNEVLPFVSNDAGEKAHDASDGKPEHEKRIVPENPFAEATSSVTGLDVCPFVRVSLEGEGVIEKSGETTPKFTRFDAPAT